ncbi:hypothetical protein GCM10020221_32220 [Streptomyces thioluteus]|uniref:Uncharacterized protein n=1 Tax=Streptomyces thioluteus TaxID=66431 RepID=A0ABN3X2E9_STRTU
MLSTLAPLNIRATGRVRPKSDSIRPRVCMAITESRPWPTSDAVTSISAVSKPIAPANRYRRRSTTSSLESGESLEPGESPAAPVRRPDRETATPRRGGTSPASSGGRRAGSVVRRTGRSIPTATSTASSVRAVSAASRSASPWSVPSAVMPLLLMRSTSVRARCPVIPVASAHRPQASESPASPLRRRCRISASRKTLAAA